MIADVDIAGAAALVHRAAGTFTKTWRRMRREEGFPSPFVGDRPGGRPWWRVADIEAWKARRAAAGQPAPRATAGDSPAQRRNAGTDPIPVPETPANDPVAHARASGNRVAQLLAAAGGD